MDIDTDPGVLQRAADQLTALAGDLLAAAHRLDELGGDGVRPRGDRLARRCADLGAGLRTDAAEVLECARLLREDRAALLAGEAGALEVLTGVRQAW